MRKSLLQVKRLCSFLVLVAFASLVYGQVIMPKFSTDEKEVWYSIRFKNGNCMLQDMGVNNPLKTQTANVAEDAQKWKLVGDQNSFQLINKTGRIAGFSSDRFRALATTNYTFKLVATTNANYEGAWELQPSNESRSMNQHGGAGNDKELGLWTAGDGNNPLVFEPTEAELPIFSEEGSEKWYFLRFKNGLGTIMDMGEGQNLLVAETDPCAEQLWKFVGTPSDFELVNKAGRSICYNGSKFIAKTGGKANLSLMATKNNTYFPGWEIQISGYSYPSMNQYQGAGIGRTLSVWNANDGNNPLDFIAEEDMTYAEYKVFGIEGYKPANKHTLWYLKPVAATTAGDRWMEYSLPIGNGQLGASIFAGIYKDEIQFNEKTLWSGRSTDTNWNYGDYENFGSVYVESLEEDNFGFGEARAVKDYYRQLDLSNATASASFKSSDKSVTYTREYITSYPDNCIAAKYTADAKGKINLRFTLKSGEPGIKARTSYSDGYAMFDGSLETISYAARLKVVPTGGTMTTDSEGIVVKGADEVLLILVGATDFDAYSATYTSNTSSLISNVKNRVDNAAAKDWGTIYSAHVLDYQHYNNRVEFELTGSENNMPTDELIKQYAKRSTGYEDYALMLEQLYFHYGRYLEICSSRGVDLPSNLQGIWNNSSEPAWNADIHANINVQMNYWPAETTNLSEMHMPFLNYIHNMAMNHTEWQGYAKASGQTKGWTCYTENNIFGGVGSFMHNYVIANAWYCTHLWQHYRYTLDREFLKEKAVPAMWSACEYWMERMVVGTDGTYECPNEYSPEHGPGARNATAHAQQLVWDLFANMQSAFDILGNESGVGYLKRKDFKKYYEKIDRGLAKEVYTGAWGETLNGVSKGDTLLREWKADDYTAGANGHRHLSHLMCLYPFNQVTQHSPYFEAAVNSLKLRGDASTGWSMGWKINLWARALDGDHSHDILELALRHHSVGGGGVYYNLYDSHSPFQIDGNFGACAGIAEMCMQSHSDTLQLLPALPSVWKNGTMKGLRAVGMFEVDQTWKDGELTEAVVKSDSGLVCHVNYKGIVGKKVTDAEGNEVEYTVVGENTISFPTVKGGVYTIDMAQLTGIKEVQNAVCSFRVEMNGSNISIEGDNFVSAQICDMAGKTLFSTTDKKFTLNPSWGKTVLLSIAGLNGSVESMLLLNK